MDKFTNNIEEQKLMKLVKYLNFHNHQHASHYNTVDSVLLPSIEIKNCIEDACRKLELNYELIKYSSLNIQNQIESGKHIFIIIDSKFFNSDLNKYLQDIRDHNYICIDGVNKITPHPNTRLILVAGENDVGFIKELYKFTDHALELYERSE